MTHLQKIQAIDLLNAMVQKEINGKNYFNFEEEKIDYCGGHQIVIKNLPLLFDSDLISIIAVCQKLCLQFKLELNEKQITLS